MADPRVQLSCPGGNKLRMEFKNFDPTRSQMTILAKSIFGMWGLRDRIDLKDRASLVRDYECWLDLTVTEQNLFEIVKKISTVLAIEVAFDLRNELLDQQVWITRIVEQVDS